MEDWQKELYRFAPVAVQKEACAQAGINYSEDEEQVFSEVAELDAESSIRFVFELNREELNQAIKAELESRRLTDLPDLGF